MTALGLWAPFASQVLVETAAGARRRLRPDDGGWWRGEADVADGYWFVVDDLRMPDPRSRRQPAGLDGPSFPDDPAAFEWTDAGWRGRHLGDAVIYELHVGTFSAAGTFAGVIDHLPHLVELGVTAIELMPVNSFPGRWGWGYDGALLGAVHRTYGEPDDLRRLVDACHASGVAVLLDVVYNHLGPTGNHLGRLGPFFTDRYPTPWGDAVNLDGPGSDEVRRFIVDNALAWIADFHLDGLRLDAVHALRDASATHLLEELTTEVHALGEQLGRQVWVIAESDLNDPRLLRSVAHGGYALDASWNDDFHHALHTALTGERSGYYGDFAGWPDVARSLHEGYVYAGRYAPSRQRRHGRPLGEVPRRRLLGYVQTHDQVGNRALGERLAHLVDRRAAQAAAALVLTAPFVPMLFQGEEWAASSPFQFFTDHTDPAVAEATRAGRRREFASFESFAGEVPDPQDPATFHRSKLRWDELGAPDHAEMLRWYRALIALRATCPDLRSDGPGDTEARFDLGGRCLRVRRGRAEVIVNLSRAPLSVAVDGSPLALSNDARATIVDDQLALATGCIAVCVPARADA